MSKSTIEFTQSTVSGIVPHTAVCGHCGYTRFGATLHATERPTASDVLADHLAQHAPGRAVDIEVDWEPSALCSVCEDGIGLIKPDDDGGLECEECGTVWDINGTGGERSEKPTTQQN